MQINAGHYSGCCYEWPWREVYYILNLADIFYHALLLITIHSRWADVHIYTHRHTHRGCVKVIMMAVWRASEAFRWVILIGKHRQDTLSFPLQIKGVSAPLLLFSSSTNHLPPCLPLTLRPLLIWLNSTRYLQRFISNLILSQWHCCETFARSFCILFLLSLCFYLLCLILLHSVKRRNHRV